MRGREPTRPVGQGCMLHGGDPGGHVSLSVMLGPLHFLLGNFSVIFLRHGEDIYDKEVELPISQIILSHQSWGFHIRESYCLCVFFSC